MKVAIFGKKISRDALAKIQSLFDILHNKNVETIFYQPFFKCLSKKKPITLYSLKTFSHHYDLNKSFNYLISIGGDGTILDAVTFIRNKNIPIIGINTGRLGFLSNISTTNIKESISQILNNNITIEERALLKITAKDKLSIDFNFALNEISFIKKDSGSMITINVFADNVYANTYWADGLIIATPTGSTAYSLSVSGPIVMPNSNNIILSPIAPHTLTVRPIVIKDSTKLKIDIEGRNKNYLLTLDSRSEKISSSNEFYITKANFTIKIVNINNNSYFSMLRNKLMWGVDKRN